MLYALCEERKYMWFNYLKIIFRNLIKNKSFSLINILGLAVGLSCTIIISLYIQDQLSYDKSYKNADNIYRLVLDVKSGSGVNKYSTTSPPMGPALVERYPDFKEAVRVRSGSSSLMESEKLKAYEEQILFVDSNFVNFFSFPLVEGNPSTALDEPNTIILTDQSAKKYFGDENPIGKTLLMDGRFNLKVTGVLSPGKFNSHIKFDFLVSFSTFPSTLPPGYSIDDWGWTSFFTYVRLNENANPKQAESKLPLLVSSAFSKESAKRISLKLEPVTGVYFDNERVGDFGAVGNKSSLYILGIIAVLSLLIACFNFINLSTARSARRGKEVGLRKVLGAQKLQLKLQFISESVIISFIAVMCSILLVEVFIGMLSNQVGINISLSEIPIQYSIAVFLLLPLFIGILAGTYPAFVLSKFLPTKVLKGNISSGSSPVHLRKILVVSQFIVSTVLIIGTLVVAKQMDYVKNKDLGFDKDQVVVIKLRGDEALQKYSAIKNAMLENPEILDVGGARNGLDGGFGSNSIFVQNDNNSRTTRFETYIYPVHYNFFKTLDMKFISGRSFDENYSGDRDNSLILNQSAVKQFGLKNPAGKQIRLGRGPLRTVIGVVEDFNYTSLHNKIEPLVFYISTDNAENMFLKLQAGNIQSAITKIDESWKKVLPDYPLDYSFLDERINNIYKSDMNFASLVNLFSALAVIIACLGLFGLTSYITEQRTKEIGIRKVLGASIADVLIITSKQFITLIVTANILAWPLAYYFMNKWLQDFSYKTEMNLWLFVAAGSIALAIAVLTISYHAIKAATSNPIDSLRYE